MAVSKVFQLRLSQEERENWDWAASKSGMTTSAWVRRLAREDYEATKARIEDEERSKREREELKKVAFPQKPGKCTHVKKGFFCYLCSKVNW
jgi:hypothetical protein